jgi:hypothetical protein
MMAIESALNPAAGDARRMAGDAYYTGCRLRQDLEAVEVWLHNAPSHVSEELEAKHPGVYLIHNDTPHTLSELCELSDSLDVAGLKSEGIHVVQVGPTHDGYLHVAVMGDVPTAQARLDGMLGSHVAHVEYGEPLRH